MVAGEDFIFWEGADGRLLGDCRGVPVLCDTCGPPVEPEPPKPVSGWWAYLAGSPGCVSGGVGGDSFWDRIYGWWLFGYGEHILSNPGGGVATINGHDYPLGQAVSVDITDPEIIPPGSSMKDCTLYVYDGPYNSEEAAEAAFNAMWEAGGIPKLRFYERVLRTYVTDPACTVHTPVFARVVFTGTHQLNEGAGSHTKTANYSYDRVHDWYAPTYDGRWLGGNLWNQSNASPFPDDPIPPVSQINLAISKFQYPMHLTVSEYFDPNSWPGYTSGSGSGDIDVPFLFFDFLAVDGGTGWRINQLSFPQVLYQSGQANGIGIAGWCRFGLARAGSQSYMRNDLSVSETETHEEGGIAYGSTTRTQTLTKGMQDAAMIPFPTVDISSSWSITTTMTGEIQYSESFTGRIQIIPILIDDYLSGDTYAEAYNQLTEELKA